MCSIGEDDFGDDGGVHSMQNDFVKLQIEKNTFGDICPKCNKGKIVIKTRFRDGECKECFLLNVHHKFRAKLGSTKLIPKDALVLLIIDGSPESVVLLDMLYYAQNQDNFKKLRCNAKVLYVDDIFLMDSSSSQNKKEFACDKIQKIENIFNKYNLDSFYISIASDINDIPLHYDEYQKLNLIEKQNNFQKTIETHKSLTLKQDFLMKTRKNIFRSSAKYLNCNYIFISDISSNLAVTFLTNISLGYGVSIGQDISFVDDRVPDIKIVRPLKDLTSDEIFNYIMLNDLNYMHNFQNYGEGNEGNSIQNLTKLFIKNLEDNFPSTVSTISRTGDKISPFTASKHLNKEPNNDEKCTFCHSKLDCKNSGALEAIKFSKIVSTESHKNVDINVNINLDEEFDDYLLKKLCYSCRNLNEDLTK